MSLLHPVLKIFSEWNRGGRNGGRERGKEKRRTKKRQEQRRPGNVQGDGQKQATEPVGRTPCHHQTSGPRFPLCHLRSGELSAGPRAAGTHCQKGVSPVPDLRVAASHFHSVTAQVPCLTLGAWGMRKETSCVFTFYIERLSLIHKMRSLSSARKGWSFH